MLNLAGCGLYGLRPVTSARRQKTWVEQRRTPAPDILNMLHSTRAQHCECGPPLREDASSCCHAATRDTCARPHGPERWHLHDQDVVQTNVRDLAPQMRAPSAGAGFLCRSPALAALKSGAPARSLV